MTGKEFRKLTVITEVDHFRNQEGKLIAYTPYVREMDLWCELFAEVHIYAPGFRLTSNTTLTAFKYNNIKQHFLVFNNSSNISGLKYVSLLNKILIFIRLLEIPLISLQLFFGILKAEIVLVRSPGYTALVANLILRVIKKITIVKWAGGFHNYPNERFLSKFQRKLLLSCNDKTRVLVYDKVENPRFIHFIPALMSKSEIKEGLELSKNKLWDGVTKILCVGRLHRDKGFELVLEAMGIVSLKATAFKWELYFVGSGNFISRLKEISAELNLSDKVSFIGALSFAETQKYYARANIVIMPGVKEGWPKVIAEGWAHNAFVLAANRGNVPDILSSGAGFAFEPNPADLAKKLIDYFEGKIDYKSILHKGIEEVQNYSLEAFKMRINDLIHELKSTKKMSDIEFYNRFVDKALSSIGFRIMLIDEGIIIERLDEIMKFVNDIRNEFHDEYGWFPEPREYFLNPLIRKFQFSFLIVEIRTNKICFINFSSQYGEALHNHCTYVGKNYRSMGLAKYHIVRLCNEGMTHGLMVQEGYWPKHNNESIILFLKMGWQIEEIRKNGTQLYMRAENQLVRDRTYRILTLEK